MSAATVVSLVIVVGGGLYLLYALLRGEEL